MNWSYANSNDRVKISTHRCVSFFRIKNNFSGTCVIILYNPKKNLTTHLWKRLPTKKKQVGGIKKKNKPRNKKNKTKKPPHSLLETEDLNNLIWS